MLVINAQGIVLVNLTYDGHQVQGIGLVGQTLDWLKPKHNVLVKLTKDSLQVQGMGLVGQTRTSVTWIGWWRETKLSPPMHINLVRFCYTLLENIPNTLVYDLGTYAH